MITGHKADLEYKAEATFRTEKMQWANLEHFYDFLSKQVEELFTVKKPLRLRGMEIIESESEGEDDEGDGEGGENRGGNAHEYAVGNAQIVISGKSARKKSLVMTRLPMMRRLWFARATRREGLVTIF